MKSVDMPPVTRDVIRTALREGRFVPWFQPIVSLETGSLTGYEVLARLNEDGDSLRLPKDFVSTAADAELLGDVEWAVLAKAIESGSRLSEPLFLAVTVSGTALTDISFVDSLVALLEARVDPARLHLAITEHDLASSHEVTERIIELERLGVRWYLDDCGVGTYSMGHLVDLPFAGLRLDRSVTVGIGAGDAKSMRVGWALVGMARGLGLDTVAKGVATANEAFTLSGQGWEFALGAHYGSPAAILAPRARGQSGIPREPAVADPLARDLAAARAAHGATREILRARNTEAVQAAILKLCSALGAQVTTGDSTDPDVVPIDLALGERDSVLPYTADPYVRGILTQYLVPAVSDARLVVERGYKAERLLENATTDPLTGLWSRRALTMALNRSKAGDSVALMDLDRFKEVNDTLGHDAGDDVLAAFGAFLRSKVRVGDVIGRLGGEEFVLIMPSTGLVQAVEVVERLRAEWAGSAPQAISFSAGVAEVSQDVEAWLAGHEALKQADAAMYLAKSAGRDRVEPARPSSGEREDPGSQP